jgi:hypothetical protein
MKHIRLFESFSDEPIVIPQFIKDRLRDLCQYLQSRDLWGLSIDCNIYYRDDRTWKSDWPIRIQNSEGKYGVYIHFNRTPEDSSASGGMYSDKNPHIYFTKETKPREVDKDIYISPDNPLGRAASGTLYKGTYLDGRGYINHVISRACAEDEEFKKLLWDLITDIQGILPY